MYLNFKLQFTYFDLPDFQAKPSKSKDSDEPKQKKRKKIETSDKFISGGQESDENNCEENDNRGNTFILFEFELT